MCNLLIFLFVVFAFGYVCVQYMGDDEPENKAVVKDA
jgi:hypothetical protein